jgi:hypothetical protein
VQLAQRRAQQRMQGGLELEDRRRLVQLLPGHLKGVERRRLDLTSYCL